MLFRSVSGKTNVDNDIEEGDFLHTFIKSDDEEKHQTLLNEHHFDEEEMPTPPTLPSFLTDTEPIDSTQRLKK